MWRDTNRLAKQGDSVCWNLDQDGRMRVHRHLRLFAIEFCLRGLSRRLVRHGPAAAGKPPGSRGNEPSPR